MMDIEEMKAMLNKETSFLVPGFGLAYGVGHRKTT
jgi:hypothetical protein